MKKTSRSHEYRLQLSLASALTLYSYTLSNNQKSGEALSVATEAIEIFDEVFDRHDVVKRDYLIGYCNALDAASQASAESGALGDAIANSEKSVKILQSMFDDYQGDCKSALALCLNSLANRLSEANMFPAALEFAAASETLHSELVADFPDVYSYNAALARTNLAAALVKLGENLSAFEVASRAVNYFETINAEQISWMRFDYALGGVII